MRNMVGRDFSAFEKRGMPRWVLPAALAALVACFGLVRLRTEVLKLRYELAQQLSEEQRLASEVRELTVEMRQLREPRQLARRAAELGFERPAHLIDLTAPPEDREHAFAAAEAPSQSEEAPLRVAALLSREARKAASPERSPRVESAATPESLARTVQRVATEVLP